MQSYEHTLGRADKVVRNNAKSFHIRVGVSPEASVSKIIQKSAKAVLTLFKGMHKKGKIAKNLRIEIKGVNFDPLIDIGEFSQKCHALIAELERGGMPRPTATRFYHEQSNVLAIDITASWLDIDELDDIPSTATWSQR